MSSPNKAEKAYHDRLCNEVGCIVCRVHIGIINCHVSIHHIDGRTKKGAQMNVIPLCGQHHQTGGEGVALHPFTAQWERNFGTQAELKRICDAQLFDLPDETPLVEVIEALRGIEGSEWNAMDDPQQELKKLRGEIF